MLARTVPASTRLRVRVALRARAASVLFALSLLLAPGVSAQTVYVSPSGSDAAACTLVAPCRSITRGVSVVPAGGTVQASAGSYAETVTVTKPVTIRGARAGISPSLRSAGSGSESILNLAGFTVGFEIQSDDVTIDGFDIVGGGSTWTGVSMFGPYDKVKVQFNFIHGMSGVNPNSTSFAYSHGIYGQGGGTPGNRGAITNLSITNNSIYELGGSVVVSGISGGAGIFLFSLTGNSMGTGALISSNSFSKMENGVHGVVPQPGIGVAVLQDDDPTPLDTGAKISLNTYSDLIDGVVIQTGDSQVGEQASAYTGVPVYITNVGNVATVNEPLLQYFNKRANEHQIAFPFLASGTSYYPINQTRHVDANTGDDNLNLCTDSSFPCRTIQWAVDRSFDGDVVEVEKGVYSESVTVDKGITIYGARAGDNPSTRMAGSASESVLNLAGKAVGFQVASSNVTIDGFDLAGTSSTWTGINMFGTYDRVVIQNNFIHGMSGVNPNSTSFAYSHGVYGQGGGTPGNRGTLTGIVVSGNHIYNLGGSAVPTGTSGGAGIFLFSLTGNDTGTGALVAGNAFFDMKNGVHNLVPQPGIGVAVLQDDDPTPQDTGVQITANTYRDLVDGVVMQTANSRVTETSSAFTDVPVFITNVQDLGQVNEPALQFFNKRANEHQIAFPFLLPGTSYYPLNQARYVNASTGNDNLNLCTDSANPCRTIQWAVDRAFDGDTIFVSAGTYAESVVVNKEIDVLGAGEMTSVGVPGSGRTRGSASESILDAAAFPVGFQVAASHVTISGFDIKGGAATWAGVSMFGSFDGVTIKNNFIHGMTNSNPNSSNYSYSHGIYGQGGGVPGNRGDLTNLTITGNHILQLGGAPVFNGSSGGAGVFLFSVMGASAGAGVSITGNIFETMANGTHTSWGPQAGLGVGILQDDEVATVDGGASISGNTYRSLAMAVGVDAVNSLVSELHASFSGVRVYVLNIASRSVVDEAILHPYAFSTSPQFGLLTAPSGSVAYFANVQDAIDYSGNPAIVTIDGNLSGVSTTVTLTRIVAEAGQVVIYQNGVEVYRGSGFSIAGIVFEGTPGSDSLEIDAAVLGLLPTGTIQFNGAAGSDFITVNGPGGINKVHHLFENQSDGIIEVDDRVLVRYTGIEPIFDNMVAVNRIFSYTAGADNVVLHDDGTAGNGYSFIDSDTGESVTFRHPSATMVINLGAGSDTITMTEMDSTFPPAILVTVNGESGSDRFNVTPSVTYNIKVNGSTPTVAPGDKLDIDLAGATGAVLSNLGGDGNWTFTNRKSVFFTGIETQLDDPSLSDLELVKSTSTTTAYPSDVLVFRLDVTNKGLATATGVEITDLLPAQLTCVCAAVATEGTVVSSGGPGGSVVWSGISLAAGETATLRYSVSVATSAISGSATNSASITASSPADSDLTNNASSVTIAFDRPIRFPTNAVVQAITFYTNTLGVTETLMGTHNQGLYRNIPGFIGSRWAPVLGSLPANLFVNDLLVSSTGTIYMATAHWGGLLTSTDGGKGWTPVDFGGPTLTTVHAVAESPSDGIIYISADDGQVWRLVGGSFWDFAGRLPGGASHTPWTLVADPTVPGRIYAGTFGDGVWRSDDYGENWRKVSGLLFPNAGSTHVFDLEFDPELVPTTLWAGTAVGIFFSQDNGATWTDASAGLGKFKEVRSIAFGPVDPSPTGTGPMYVATWGGGVFELPTNRATLPSWFPVALRFQQVSVVAVTPDGGELVAAPSVGGVFTMALSGTATETEAAPEIPTGVELAQNYPNPFNPATRIGFGIPAAGRVTVTVHDMMGRLVATLSDGTLPAGHHEVVFDARDLPSGPYVYRLRTDKGSTDRVMMLLK